MRSGPFSRAAAVGRAGGGVIAGAEPAGAAAASAIVRASVASVMSVEAPGAELEELVQLGREVLVGGERDAVDAELQEQPVATLLHAAHVVGVALAERRARGVHGDPLAGLHV